MTSPLASKKPLSVDARVAFVVCINRSASCTGSHTRRLGEGHTKGLINHMHVRFHTRTDIIAYAPKKQAADLPSPHAASYP